MPAHGGGTRGFIPRAGEQVRTGADSKPWQLPGGCAWLCCALTPPSKERVKAQLV